MMEFISMLEVRAILRSTEYWLIERFIQGCWRSMPVVREYLSRYPELLAAGVAALGHAGNNFAADNLFVNCKSAFTVKTTAAKALISESARILKTASDLAEIQAAVPEEVHTIRERLNAAAITVSPRDVTKEIQ